MINRALGWMLLVYNLWLAQCRVLMHMWYPELECGQWAAKSLIRWWLQADAANQIPHLFSGLFVSLHLFLKATSIWRHCWSEKSFDLLCCPIRRSYGRGSQQRSTTFAIYRGHGATCELFLFFHYRFPAPLSARQRMEPLYPNHDQWTTLENMFNVKTM